MPAREEDGGFSVTVPDRPGCVSQGETEQEALANVRAAIEGYIEGMKAGGLPIPEPHTSIASPAASRNLAGGALTLDELKALL